MVTFISGLINDKVWDVPPVPAILTIFGLVEITSEYVSPNLILLSSTLNTKYPPVFNPDATSDEAYDTLSPVLNKWLVKDIWFVDVLIPKEVNPTGFTRRCFDWSSNFTITDDAVVPIPTERFGTTFNSTKSSFLRSCEVDTETFVFMEFTVAVIWVNVDSNKYLSSSDVVPDANPLKYTSLLPMLVLIPMTFLDLLTA